MFVNIVVLELTEQYEVMLYAIITFFILLSFDVITMGGEIE